MTDSGIYAKRSIVFLRVSANQQKGQIQARRYFNEKLFTFLSVQRRLNTRALADSRCVCVCVRAECLCAPHFSPSHSILLLVTLDALMSFWPPLFQFHHLRVYGTLWGLFACTSDDFYIPTFKPSVNNPIQVVQTWRWYGGMYRNERFRYYTQEDGFETMKLLE